MPYILKDTRKLLTMSTTLAPRTSGELCFLLTTICKRYLETSIENFDRWGDNRHALASAWEVYFLPRLLNYEASKCKENGDL